MTVKQYAIGLALFLLALAGYHYYAASQAAGQIDEALQEQSTTLESSFSLKYSEIEVNPFAGDILLHDLSYQQKELQLVSPLITLDMTYLDFLRFYVGGSEFGLKKLLNSSITIQRPDLELPKAQSLISADMMDIQYNGQLYDLLRYIVGGYPLEQGHELESYLKSARYQPTETSVGEIAIDSLTLEAQVPAESSTLLQANHMMTKGNGITWNPPEAFASQYEFFIRGFGYTPDSVGLDSMALQLHSISELSSTKKLQFDLYTDLFHLQSRAGLILNTTSPQSWVFRNGSMGLPEISGQFENFLDNSEQLLGISIRDRKELLLFKGPVTDPDFRLR